MKNYVWFRILMVLIFLIPLAFLFLAPGVPMHFAGSWFWVALLVCFFLIFSMLGMSTPETAEEPAGPKMIHEQEQPDAIKEIMSVRVATEEPSGVRVFRGRLRESAARAYEKLRTGLSDSAGSEADRKDHHGTSGASVGQLAAVRADDSDDYLGGRRAPRRKSPPRTWPIRCGPAILTRTPGHTRCA